MLRALLPRCSRFVCTAAPNPRALPPATLASLVEQLGAAAEIVPAPRAAVARAQELAGPEGAVIVTGSIYLIAELVSAPGRGGPQHCERQAVRACSGWSPWWRSSSRSRS